MKKTYVQIENKGEIDTIGLTLMGISSKRGDDGKIGFFGSGNKYSIALMLREKIPFRIFSGTREVKIKTEKVMFRGTLYEQIIIDGEKTSLTTSMGPDWEPWFAVRELYCNAVDEGDAALTVTQTAKGAAGTTRVFVGMTAQLEDFFKTRDRYILIGEAFEASEQTEHGRVDLLVRKAPEFNCYRKGIRIYPSNSRESLYWYNFGDIQINESRTYKYEHQIRERIAAFYATTNNKSLIVQYLMDWKGNYEEHAAWEYVSAPLSEMWHTILKGHRVYPENLAVRSGDFEGKHNSFIVPEQLAKKIAAQFQDIEVVGSEGRKRYVELKMTAAERQMFDEARRQLAGIGYDVQSKIVLVETTTSDVIAWYERKTDTIYHTRRHLHGMKELKNTLLEEHFHALGHEDGQRAFVTFLLNELIDARSAA